LRQFPSILKAKKRCKLMLLKWKQRLRNLNMRIEEVQLSEARSELIVKKKTGGTKKPLNQSKITINSML
jgi:hypothetical protein